MGAKRDVPRQTLEQDALSVLEAREEGRPEEAGGETDRRRVQQGSPEDSADREAGSSPPARRQASRTDPAASLLGVRPGPAGTGREGMGRSSRHRAPHIASTRMYRQDASVPGSGLRAMSRRNSVGNRARARTVDDTIPTDHHRGEGALDLGAGAGRERHRHETHRRDQRRRQHGPEHRHGADHDGIAEPAFRLEPPAHFTAHDHAVEHGDPGDRDEADCRGNGETAAHASRAPTPRRSTRRERRRRRPPHNERRRTSETASRR